MAPTSRRIRPTLISLATAYAEQNEEALVIPEDLTVLSDTELTELAAAAGEAFDGLYGDGTAAFSEDEMGTLSDLTTAIEALATEQATRTAAATDRREAAAALAARVHPDGEGDEPADETDAGGDEEAPAEGDEEAEDEGEDEPDAPADQTEDEGAAETIAASGARRRDLSINVSSRRAPKPARKPTSQTRSLSDYATATSDVLGVPAGSPVGFAEMGKMLDKRLSSFSLGQYQTAAARGQHIREQHSLVALKRSLPKEFMAGGSAESVQAAIDHARDQKRLPGGALTAAGWCAPSEPIYEVCYGNASRDGILSLPEVGISRGGILVPSPMTYSDIYDNIGFHFTEQDAIDGKYAPGATPGAPNVVGPKPCYEIECPTWEDIRLEGDGLCITADILQQKAFPEALAGVTQQALIAHDHKINASVIGKIVAGSTAVTMTTGTVGTTAPVLAAVELQVEHYRYTHRLARTAVLEAVFPFWIKGAIRQDLSVRLGIDLLAVTDQIIDTYFRIRGVQIEYVYDWQDITGDPAAFLTWNTTVQFLLYEAGTWIKGVDDIITLDSLYDSVLLGENKFTALFTEEASLVAKVCDDSRVITVPVWSDGSTHAGVLLENTLKPTPAA